ncbi:MAG: ADP-ribose diphosphatase [Alphaproteobacteria bacterium]|nr:ADP-ribose diphosphatase [Alphaproteobacteria bacterium]
MKRSDVKIIEKNIAYDGHFRIDRYRLRHKLFAGGWGKELVRELFERGHAVAVLPYDPVRDEVVLVEQFRIGAYAAGCDPWLIEIIAGIIDAGETAEAVARREAVEEAGLDIGEMIKIADYLASPGGTSETVTLYCGRVDAGNAGGIHGLATEGEDIRVTTLPAVAIADLLAETRTHNATLLIALQWLMLHRDELRERWR